MSNTKDRAILNSIFNPLLPIGEFVYDEEIPEELKDFEHEDSTAYREAKALEMKGVKEAEDGKVDDAIKTLSSAINVAPNKASCYNNRAQAHRLKGNIGDAMADLDTAIRLSEGKGRTACQAYIQRAMIKRLQYLDEDAREDFQAAANLGSEFAKSQVVQMNPYAALCNKMLHGIFKKMTEDNTNCNGV